MEAGESWEPVTPYFMQLGEIESAPKTQLIEIHERPLVQLFVSDDVPDVQVVQFTAAAKPITTVKPVQENKKWVELPDCVGNTGEVKLLPENENGTVATCKKRAGVDDSGKSQAAASALDSMTPKAE